jgi:hypothetical protein
VARTNARGPIAAAVFAAIFVAVVVGLTWRARPSHTLAGTPVGIEGVDPVAAPAQQPSASRRLPVLTPDPRLSAVATRQRLLGRSAAISASIASGRQKLAARYGSEPVDAAWAQRKEKALASANDASQLADLDAKPLSFSAQCRSTVCLIGADFASTLAADDWVSLYTLVAGPEVSRAAMQRSQNPDGTVHLRVYAAAR